MADKFLGKNYIASPGLEPVTFRITSPYSTNNLLRNLRIKGEARCETGDVRQEMWDRRLETEDARQETEGVTQET